jgi:hypothetical protein
MTRPEADEAFGRTRKNIQSPINDAICPRRERSEVFARVEGPGHIGLAGLLGGKMSNDLEKQIIARALDLIAEQERWTRGALARTSNDRPCSWSDPHAAKFCAVGALNRAATEAIKGWGCSRAMEAQDFIMAANNRGGDALLDFNDEEGHSAVIGLFKTALGQ